MEGPFGIISPPILIKLSDQNQSIVAEVTNSITKLNTASGPFQALKLE